MGRKAQKVLLRDWNLQDRLGDSANNIPVTVLSDFVSLLLAVLCFLHDPQKFNWDTSTQVTACLHCEQFI